METISQKKHCFPVEKQVWPNFSRITQYGRAQVTIFYAPQDTMAIIVQVIISFP